MVPGTGSDLQLRGENGINATERFFFLSPSLQDRQSRQDGLTPDFAKLRESNPANTELLYPNGCGCAN